MAQLMQFAASIGAERLRKRQAGGDAMIDLLGVHMLTERHLHMRDPRQRRDLTANVVGHQKREVRGAPVGRQPEADRHRTRIVDLQPFDEPQIRDRFIEFRIVDAGERTADIRHALRRSIRRAGLRHGHAIAFSRVVASFFFCASTSIP
jgi:hypothetical protein